LIFLLWQQIKAKELNRIFKERKPLAPIG